MGASEPFLEQLSALARSLQDGTGTQPTLDAAVAAAPHIIDGCDLAGICIATASSVHTRDATDEAVLRLGALQHELREGPSVDAVRDEETIHSPDLATDGRWPRWGPRVVAELGIRSVLSYRLFTTRDTLGTLNLLSHEPNAFDDEAVHHGLALAAHVAVALAAEQDDEHMHIALKGRTVIGQAQGILMERFDLSAERAFDVLARFSSHQNIKLHQVATQLVSSRQVPPPEG